MQYAGGNKMENIFFIAHDYGVPGVISSLITHNVVDFLGQDIDHLALTFIPPLRTY
jgi:hypothetical protein